MSEKPHEEPTTAEIMLHDGRKVTFEGRSPRECWALLARVPLERADFQHRDYVGFEMAGLDFKQAVMTACDFSEANFSQAVLDAVAADGAIFTNANLSDATLQNTILIDADFRGASLHRAHLTNVTASGATFDQADMRNVSLRDKSRFCSASLEEVDARSAVFGNTDFSGAILDGANLDNVDLRGALFTGASLRGVSLRKARIGGAGFANADLTEVDLADVTFEGNVHCNFTGMILHGAKNVPVDFFEWGELFELGPLIRRTAHRLPKAFSHNDISSALRKLWLDRAVSGGDLLLEPLDDLIDAAHALAIALAANRPKSRF